MVLKENLVTLDLREPPDLRERREREDPLVSWEPTALLVSVEREALPEAAVCLVLMDEVDLLACLEPVDPLEPPAPEDPQETQVVLESPVLLVSGDSLEALAALDLQGRRDLQGPLEWMAALALLDPPALVASLETLASLDPKGLVVSLVNLETKEPPAPLV